MTVKPGLSVVEPGIRGSMFDFGAGGVAEANVCAQTVKMAGINDSTG